MQESEGLSARSVSSTCQSPSSLNLSTRRTHAVTLKVSSSWSERGAQRSRGPTGRRNATVIDTIGIEVPGGRIVQLGGEDSVESAAAARVAHRRDHLDPVP